MDSLELDLTEAEVLKTKFHRKQRLLLVHFSMHLSDVQAEASTKWTSQVGWYKQPNFVGLCSSMIHPNIRDLFEDMKDKYQHLESSALILKAKETNEQKRQELHKFIEKTVQSSWITLVHVPPVLNATAATKPDVIICALAGYESGILGKSKRTFLRNEKFVPKCSVTAHLVEEDEARSTSLTTAANLRPSMIYLEYATSADGKLQKGTPIPLEWKEEDPTDPTSGILWARLYKITPKKKDEGEQKKQIVWKGGYHLAFFAQIQSSKKKEKEKIQSSKKEKDKDKDKIQSSKKEKEKEKIQSSKKKEKEKIQSSKKEKDKDKDKIQSSKKEKEKEKIQSSKKEKDHTEHFVGLTLPFDIVTNWSSQKEGSTGDSLWRLMVCTKDETFTAEQKAISVETLLEELNRWFQGYVGTSMGLNNVHMMNLRRLLDKEWGYFSGNVDHWKFQTKLWPYFFNATEFIRKNRDSLWEDNLMNYCFVSSSEAEALLSQKETHTFLIRFQLSSKPIGLPTISLIVRGEGIKGIYVAHVDIKALTGAKANMNDLSKVLKSSVLYTSRIDEKTGIRNKEYWSKPTIADFEVYGRGKTNVTNSSADNPRIATIETNKNGAVVPYYGKTPDYAIKIMPVEDSELKDQLARLYSSPLGTVLSSNGKRPNLDLEWMPNEIDSINVTCISIPGRVSDCEMTDGSQAASASVIDHQSTQFEAPSHNQTAPDLQRQLLLTQSIADQFSQWFDSQESEMVVDPVQQESSFAEGLGPNQQPVQPVSALTSQWPMEEGAYNSPPEADPAYRQNATIIQNTGYTHYVSAAQWHWDETGITQSPRGQAESSQVFSQNRFTTTAVHQLHQAGPQRAQSSQPISPVLSVDISPELCNLEQFPAGDPYYHGSAAGQIPLQQYQQHISHQAYNQLPLHFGAPQMTNYQSQQQQHGGHNDPNMVCNPGSHHGMMLWQQQTAATASYSTQYERTRPACQFQQQNLGNSTVPIDQRSHDYQGGLYGTRVNGAAGSYRFRTPNLQQHDRQWFLPAMYEQVQQNPPQFIQMPADNP